MFWNDIRIFGIMHQPIYTPSLNQRTLLAPNNRAVTNSIVQTLTFITCVRQVLFSNLGRTPTLMRAVVGFLIPLRQIPGDNLPQIRPRPLPSRYGEFYNFVGRLTDLRFTATRAPLVARRIRILWMNQHASWPITFGMNGSN
jgi:hypothetical protein